MNDTIDQKDLANSVAEKIKYEFFDYFLVKPLDPVKVTKEITKPVSTGTPVEDANGIVAEDYNNVEKEIVEVDSDYRKGVVIKKPLFYTKHENEQLNVEVGDIVVFHAIGVKYFDLVKDTMLIKQYNIVAIER